MFMFDLLDAAIVEVDEHRRDAPGDPGEAPDPMLFDQQTLDDLLAFLRDTRRGLLPREEVVEEASMWRQLVDVGWPVSAGDSPVEQAVALLADTPPPAGASPVNGIELAMAAVVHDRAARPRLWQALYDGELVLPVVRPEGGELEFLTAPADDDAHVVLGFASESRFDALLPEGAAMSRLLAPGPDLPKVWPAGHWLVINPGHPTKVMLSPWEVTGLPHGGPGELPHPGRVDLTPPPDDDERALLLAAALASEATAGCGEIHWARMRKRHAPHRTPWQDVLVVSADAQALRAALPPAVFPGAVVLSQAADLVHPLVEAVLTRGRRVTPL